MNEELTKRYISHIFKWAKPGVLFCWHIEVFDDGRIVYSARRKWMPKQEIVYRIDNLSKL